MLTSSKKNPCILAKLKYIMKYIINYLFSAIHNTPIFSLYRMWKIKRIPSKTKNSRESSLLYKILNCFLGVCYYLSNSLLMYLSFSLASTPPKAIKAIKFGAAIKPFMVSAKSQTTSKAPTAPVKIKIKNIIL